MGCEASKIPAEGDVFFLDFYLYRTNQDLTAKVAHDFHSTGKKLRGPRRIDPRSEGRGTRGKLLFVRILKLPP